MKLSRKQAFVASAIVLTAVAGVAAASVIIHPDTKSESAITTKSEPKSQEPAPSETASAGLPTTQPTNHPAAKSTAPTTSRPNANIQMVSVGQPTSPTCSSIGFYATIHSLGSTVVKYYWKSASGVSTPIKELTFDGVQTKTINYEMPYTPPAPDPYGRTIYMSGTAYFYVVSPNVHTVPLPYNYPVPDCVIITPQPPNGT